MLNQRWDLRSLWSVSYILQWYLTDIVWRSCKVFSLSFQIQDHKGSGNNLVHHLYTSQSPNTFLRIYRKQSPTNSHTSAPSKLPIVTSKSGLSVLTQTSCLLNSNDLRAWKIVLITLSSMGVMDVAIISLNGSWCNQSAQKLYE